MSKNFQLCVLASVSGFIFFPSLSYSEATLPGSSIGVIKFQKNHIYFYTAVAAFKDDDIVDAQYSNELNGSSCCVHFDARDFDDPVLSDDQVTDLIDGANIYRYEIKKFAIKKNGAPYMGIGLIHKPSVNINSAGEEIAWLENKLSFRASSCLSGEGVHFFRYVDNNIVSHLYHSLGYEVKPTCDPKLFSSN